MRAGRLRKRVTIQAKTVVRDGYGGETVNWSDMATIWASVEPLNGREYFAAQQEHAEVTTRIRMRYRKAITTSNRITHANRVYNIHEVINPDMRNRELVLMCDEEAL